MNLQTLLHANIDVQTALIAAGGMAGLFYASKRAFTLAKTVAFGSTFAAMLFLTGLGGTGYSLGSIFKDKPTSTALPDAQLIELAQIATPENLKTVLEYRAQHTPATAPAEERIATKDLEAIVARYVAMHQQRAYDPGAPAEVQDAPKSLLSYFNSKSAPEPIDDNNSVFRLTSDKTTVPIVMASQDDSLPKPLSWSTLALGIGLVICGIVKFGSTPG